jgi:hypothetical protein
MAAVTHEQMLTYAGIYVLKKMDLKPADGGITLPVIMDALHSPLEEVVERLVMQGHLAIDRKAQRYSITKAGYRHIGALIDEAETIIDEFDDWETVDMVAELRSRNLDPLRARFLWGWYQGEFDDLQLFQERRGVSPIEPDWPAFVTSDEFYANLALDLEGDGEGDDEGED